MSFLYISIIFYSSRSSSFIFWLLLLHNHFQILQNHKTSLPSSETLQIFSISTSPSSAVSKQPNQPRDRNTLWLRLSRHGSLCWNHPRLSTTPSLISRDQPQMSNCRSHNCRSAVSWLRHWEHLSCPSVVRNGRHDLGRCPLHRGKPYSPVPWMYHSSRWTKDTSQKLGWYYHDRVC